MASPERVVRKRARGRDEVVERSSLEVGSGELGWERSDGAGRSRSDMNSAVTVEGGGRKG